VGRSEVKAGLAPDIHLSRERRDAVFQEILNLLGICTEKDLSANAT
jgi:hypothetical protein